MKTSNDRETSGKPFPAPIVLQTHELTRVYGAKRAVADLSLTVRQSEIYGFLGRNGAGKTTTIRMILALVKPTTG